VARGGAPAVHAVDPEIFRRRYFGHCLRCTFCGDACCDHGVDVAVVERDRILARAPEIAPMIGVPPERWFEPAVQDDADFPGGSVTRTSVVDGACVFLQRDGRGCVLHAFALARGLDYHDVKPMVSALFPLTFDGEALRCSDELSTGSLVCAGSGPTAYEMAREELGYYFGAALVAELDGMAGTDGEP
jgi:Fe-S-cluster containining protein